MCVLQQSPLLLFSLCRLKFNQGIRCDVDLTVLTKMASRDGPRVWFIMYCAKRAQLRSFQSWAGANPQSLTLMAASEPHHEEVIVGAPQPSLNGLNRVAAWC